MVENKRFSMKGWNIKTWAVLNKNSLKLIVSGAAGVLTVMANASSNPIIVTAAATIVAAVSKMIMDTLDFWQSK